MFSFLKRSKELEEKVVVADPAQMTPETPGEFFERGMAHYARHEFASAEDDFKQAAASDKHAVDGYYGLGLAYKALNRVEDAIQSFQKAIDLIDSGAPVESGARGSMLRRIANSHIMQLRPETAGE